MPVHRRMGQDRKPQSLAGDVSAIHSAVDSGTRFGAMEGSCWFGPWELRVAFGWLVCLILPSSHRDVVTFYYTLWPTRTKGPIRLGSDTAHHTGCCRDGSPSPPLLPALPPENLKIVSLPATYTRKFLRLWQGCAPPDHLSGDSVNFSLVWRLAC